MGWIWGKCNGGKHGGLERCWGDPEMLKWRGVKAAIQINGRVGWGPCPSKWNEVEGGGASYFKLLCSFPFCASTHHIPFIHPPLAWHCPRSQSDLQMINHKLSCIKEKKEKKICKQWTEAMPHFTVKLHARTKQFVIEKWKPPTSTSMFFSLKINK